MENSKEEKVSYQTHMGMIYDDRNKVEKATRNSGLGQIGMTIKNSIVNAPSFQAVAMRKFFKISRF